MVDLYSQGLEQLSDVVTLPSARADIRHAWHLYIIALNTELLSVDRDDFMKALKSENVGTGIHFRSLHTQGYYRETFKYKPEDLPNAAYLTDRILSLPLYPKMDGEQASGVLRATVKLLRYYSEGR